MLINPPETPNALSATNFSLLPRLKSDGATLNPKNYIEPRTDLYLTLAYFLASLAILIAAFASAGIFLLLLLIAPIADYFNRKRVMARLHGSGIEVGPQQFSELYACAYEFAQRLGMKNLTTIYIMEDNSMNAAAMKIGGRKVIVLMDDVVDACIRSGDPQTLAFILAHEIAHHALGHTNLIRASVARYVKKISRLDEFTCDAVANQLVGNPQVSAKALTILLSGPQLLKYINLDQLAVQAVEVARNKKSVKAEGPLTHPLLLRRIQRFSVASTPPRLI